MEKLTIRENSNLKEIVSKLNKNGKGFLAIISDIGKLIGIVTDGDLRRAFLNNIKKAEDLINNSPITMKTDIPRNYVITKLKQINQRCMPIVDSNNILIDLIFLNENEFNSYPNHVIIMAGGTGSRMGSLTKNTPKPMLRLGNKPILEIVISEFVKQGFSNIILSVYYKSDIIKRYFKDGKQIGANIKYIEEKKTWNWWSFKFNKQKNKRYFHSR